MTAVERAVRAMTRPERVAYLRAAGWYRVAGGQTQMWFAPGWREYAPGLVEPGGEDRAFYSLAAAIRTALQADA